MDFMSHRELGFVRVISHLNYCNPFLPERIELEQEALGEEFIRSRSVWSLRADLPVNDPNVLRLLALAEEMATSLRSRLTEGHRPTGEEEAELYEELIFFVLYHRYYGPLYNAVKTSIAGGTPSFAFFVQFEKDFAYFLLAPWNREPTFDAARLFSGFCQIARAFHSIFYSIVGESMPIVQLRAAIWQSIFTHDMRRYWRVLYDKMGEMACLITGPSGSGKELVAQAIAMSRYVPFSATTRRFEEDFGSSFFALNLAALSPTLIESELFGHRKGAFTGALQDRQGWLEVCSGLGTVFLDEIAEIDGAIQVKLLRVLQTRTFQRLGDTTDRLFAGKIIAATNRDLNEETRAGRFREDLYYRICSDLITTPSLHAQLSQRVAGEKDNTLYDLIINIGRRILGPGKESRRLAEEALDWINENLGAQYTWPGNVRELEQCVRNILIRKKYVPLGRAGRGPEEALARAFMETSLTADQLLSLYSTLVYERTGSYQECARRLAVDHRTIKSKVDGDLFRKILG